MLELEHSNSRRAVAYPGGFLVAGPPPPAMIFVIQWGDTVTGTDLHQPFTFATFGHPPLDQLWIRHWKRISFRFIVMCGSR